MAFAAAVAKMNTIMLVITDIFTESHTGAKKSVQFISNLIPPASTLNFYLRKQEAITYKDIISFLALKVTIQLLSCLLILRALHDACRIINDFVYMWTDRQSDFSFL